MGRFSLPILALVRTEESSEKDPPSRIFSSIRYQKSESDGYCYPSFRIFTFTDFIRIRRSDEGDEAIVAALEYIQKL
jgi:hypothetical protein